MMRVFAAAALGIVLIAATTCGQTTMTTAPTTAPESIANPWAFSLSAYTYIVPDGQDYVNPNFTADRDWLHLEARYNYEALNTGSLWIGYNFSFGDKLVLDLTPMVGVVFGDLTGGALGYELSLSYEKLSLSCQGEYVIDAGDNSGNYFYVWS
ncbi:MAG: hypothetical protein ACREJC_01235, partial [Tepidisphaeraceae bacterium]